MIYSGCSSSPYVPYVAPGNLNASCSIAKATTTVKLKSFIKHNLNGIDTLIRVRGAIFQMSYAA